MRLVVAYEGTMYCGWQLQAAEPTVQGVLEAAFRQLEPGPRRVLGASRTDQGVHALGQVAWAHTERALDPERYRDALNHFLPDDVRVRSCDLAGGEAFHPLKGVLEKTYVYRVDRGAVPDPRLRRIALHRPGPLDLAAMREGLGHLLGRHDFAALGGAGSPRRTTVRTVTEAALREVEGGIELRLSADGFLYHMVRHAVGLLLEVGQGRRGPEEVPRVLAEGPPAQGLPLAPAHGLCLLGVAYGPPLPLDSRHVG